MADFSTRAKLYDPNVEVVSENYPGAAGSFLLGSTSAFQPVLLRALEVGSKSLSQLWVPDPQVLFGASTNGHVMVPH